MRDVVRGSILILMFRGSSFVKNFIIAKEPERGGAGGLYSSFLENKRLVVNAR